MPRLERTIGFNISHDNAYVVMAFQTRELDGPPQQVEDEPQTNQKATDVSLIGVDVMKIALPRFEKSLVSFVHSISDTVGEISRYPLHTSRFFHMPNWRRDSSAHGYLYSLSLTLFCLSVDAS